MLSMMRIYLGNEACNSVCTPPSPPGPPNYSCVNYLVNALIDRFIEHFNIFNLILPAFECFGDIEQDFQAISEPLNGCENECSCADPDNGPICTIQRDTCEAGCAVNHLPESCKSFIINLFGDIVIAAGGPVAEVILLLYDAVECIQSPGPF
jgi:hypothetical protein